jgi:tight adherence protein C
MSNLFLYLSLAGLFSAIVATGVWVENTLAERRRAMELLRSQVVQVTDLRETVLSNPFGERVLGPTIVWLGKVARRFTPTGSLERISQRLVLAGSPAGWDAEKVMAFKVLGALVGGLIGFLPTALAGLRPLFGVSLTAIFAYAGYLVPGAALGQSVVARKDTIRKSLADMMDLLTISVEAGLGFDAAMAHAVRQVPGPLSQEIGRMLHEIQLGAKRTDAFRKLAERTELDELRAFSLAMIQADTLGVSIAKVLRAQALDLRTRRRQRAEEQSLKTPVKLLFPMIFCVLPALFVIIVAPGAIRIAHNFLH